MLLPLLILLPRAQAHPPGATTHAHRLDVTLLEQQVEVVYTADLPLRAALAQMRTDGVADPEVYRAALADELAQGLRLLVNGAPAAWTRAQEVEAPRPDPGFLTARIHLSAALPPASALQVQLINGNLPDDPALFLTDLWIGDALALDAASLYDLDGRQLRHDRSGQWRVEEDARELRLALRLRGGLGTRWAALSHRLATDAAVLPGRLAVQHLGPLGALAQRSAAWTWGGLLALILGGAVGLILRARSRRPRPTTGA